MHRAGVPKPPLAAAVQVSRRRRRGVQVSRRAAVAARGRPLAGAGNEGNASRFSAFPEPLPPHPVTPAPRSPGFRAARRGAHKDTLLAAAGGSAPRAPRARRAIRQAGLGPRSRHPSARSAQRTEIFGRRAGASWRLRHRGRPVGHGRQDRDQDRQELLLVGSHRPASFGTDRPVLHLYHRGGAAPRNFRCAGSSSAPRRRSSQHRMLQSTIFGARLRQYRKD